MTPHELVMRFAKATAEHDRCRWRYMRLDFRRASDVMQRQAVMDALTSAHEELTAVKTLINQYAAIHKEEGK